MFPSDDIVSHALSTIKLMLTGNPSTINTQDEHGENPPLHFAVRGHARYGTKHSTSRSSCLNMEPIRVCEVVGGRRRCIAWVSTSSAANPSI